jgi:hypothetical protein
MRATTIPAVVAIFICTLPAISVGNDANERSAVSAVGSEVAVARSDDSGEVVQPWIHHKMDPVAREKLEAGFALAIERIRTVEACAALFRQLGSNGVDMLMTGLYLPVASYRHEIVVCGRDPASNSRGAEILAYTKVGGSPIWICRNFARVTIEEPATTVIHEALHQAGLEERPHHRLAMSSVEITEMVKTACGF